MTRAHQSHRAKAGNRGEAIADALHLRCELAKVACVRRVASNLRVVKSLGRGLVQAAMVKKSTIDCIGWLADGRVVAIEIKHVEPKQGAKGILPCSLPMSRVEPHQRAELDRVLKAGGVAVLLVVHGALAQYAVPWAEAREVEGSLRGEALERHKVKAGEAYLARWKRP